MLFHSSMFMLRSATGAASPSRRKPGLMSLSRNFRNFRWAGRVDQAVIPAKAGIHCPVRGQEPPHQRMDPGFRRDDDGFLGPLPWPQMPWHRRAREDLCNGHPHLPRRPPPRACRLNRPKALHALNTAMCPTMLERARCLGAQRPPLHRLYLTAPRPRPCRQGHPRSPTYSAECFAAAADFFRAEYRLNHRYSPIPSRSSPLPTAS